MPVEELTEPECRLLLASVAVGRIALTRRALPVVVPVSFWLDGPDVVFRLPLRGMLGFAPDGTVVAFEAGELDSASLTGWSVLVTGMLHAPSPALEPGTPGGGGWATDDRRSDLRIVSGLVSGRRMLAATGPPPGRRIDGRRSGAWVTRMDA